MKLYPQELEQLIEFFKKLPGIGEKSAERMALSVLELDEDYLQISASNLIEAKPIKKYVIYVPMKIETIP